MGAFRSDDRNSLREHDFQLILGFYQDLMVKKTGRQPQADIRFLLEMYCQGSVYMTVKWILGGMEEDPAQVARKLVKAMPAKLEQVFADMGLM